MKEDKMNNYTPPFTITPKILDLVSEISAKVAKLEIILKTIQASIDSDQVSDYVSDQVDKLLTVMNDQWLSSSEIMAKLDLSHKPTFRKNYLNPALEHGLVVMHDSDSPRSPKQKYRVKR